MNGADETMTTSTPSVEEFTERFRRPLSSGNAIRDFNPINIIVMLASLAVLSLALPGIIPPIAVSVAYVLIAFAAGVGRRFASTFGKLYAIVGVILFVLRAIFLDIGQQLVTFGPFVISTGGLMQALRFSLLVMALCGALTLFFAMTPMKNLMLALESRGVTPRATYVILASFQSIIDLGKNSKTVMDAQRSRGVETEGSLRIRLKAFAPILAPVFLAAMNQTEERALALDARAFNSPHRHSHLARLKPVSAVEATITAVLAALAVFSIVGVYTLWN